MNKLEDILVFISKINPFIYRKQLSNLEKAIQINLIISIGISLLILVLVPVYVYLFSQLTMLINWVVIFLYLSLFIFFSLLVTLFIKSVFVFFKGGDFLKQIDLSKDIILHDDFLAEELGNKFCSQDIEYAKQLLLILVNRYEERIKVFSVAISIIFASGIISLIYENMVQIKTSAYFWIISSVISFFIGLILGIITLKFLVIRYKYRLSIIDITLSKKKIKLSKMSENL